MKYLLIIVAILFHDGVCAQDSIKSKLQLKGYIKDLQSITFRENLTNLTTGNLIHHRLNTRWHPSMRLTAAMEVRNRLFWGEEVALNPEFSNQLRNKNEAFDLTWNLLDQERMVFNTTIDRLWLEYEGTKWNVRVGRQRVNWGIGTTWNPNDLFNTFNFLDFDYEERPGIDGVKIQYLTGDMEHLETSVAFTKQNKEIVAAIRYFKNVADYDLQLLTGIYHEQLTMGLGWSGSIRETGFKGEIQYFFRANEMPHQLNASLEADHMFSKGWYLNMGAFFNSAGTTSSEELVSLTNLEFSPRNLMPTRWNFSIMIAKELSPLINVNATIIYSPNADLTILLPAITYNAAENLDVSLVWQSFFLEQQTSFDDLSHRCFLRLKWSY